MKRITTLHVLLLVVLIITANIVQSAERKTYQFGGHSMVYQGNMKLSKINSEFVDLSGGTGDGVHHSSLFLRKRIDEFFRVGVETLVGNSSSKGDSMNYQGVGLTLDGIYGDKYFVASGLHVGAIIVNATQKEGDGEEGVYTGRFYKDSGVFIAPYIEAGGRWGESIELMATIKHVEVTLGEKNDNISAFSGPYVGVGWAIGF